MRAIRFHEYGGPEVLRLETIERPEPREGQVLVRVRAVGVNPADWKFRKGNLRAFRPVDLPQIPGYDVAGTVEAIGPGVTSFKVGDAVFGGGNRTYAEYCAIPADNVAFKPKNLNFDEAASVNVGSVTSWQGLFDVGGLQSGQKLLVHGGAGGVGLYGVQFGKWKGAHVTATASARNVDYVTSIGADAVIDYTQVKFEDVVKDQDVVFDTVGGDLIDRSWGVLRKGGILVTAAGRGSDDKAKKYGMRTGSVQAKPTTQLLTQIAHLIEYGKVRPLVQKVFPLHEAARAHALSETGHGRGRIVLHVAD